jgi:DNA-binding transcriptional LysR family regulator
VGTQSTVDRRDSSERDFYYWLAFRIGMLDVSAVDLAVLRAVAQRGSFTAAAGELGYTQSAVSKRVAALETAIGRRLFERERTGVRLTAAGEVVLRHAAAALDALGALERDLSDDATPGRPGPVRLGAFASALAGIVPSALAGVDVTLREGTSAALVRALRAGTLDLALLASAPPFHPPDRRDPPLIVEHLSEGELRIAVGASHRFAGRRIVAVDELAGERWVVARQDRDDHRLGAWPGMPGRPRAPFVARDWLSKLRLVASGAAITTIPDVLLPALPPDIRTVAVTGAERRRLLLVRAPGPAEPAVEHVAAALRSAAQSVSEARLIFAGSEP